MTEAEEKSIFSIDEKGIIKNLHLFNPGTVLL